MPLINFCTAVCKVYGVELEDNDNTIFKILFNMCQHWTSLDDQGIAENVKTEAAL